MEIISPLLKTFKTLDGKPLSLDQVTISRSSIRRKRIIYRDQISDEAYEEFQVNMPEHCILHWDSKALADMDGVMHETQVDEDLAKEALKVPHRDYHPLLSFLIKGG